MVRVLPCSQALNSDRLVPTRSASNVSAEERPQRRPKGVGIFFYGFQPAQQPVLARGLEFALQNSSPNFVEPFLELVVEIFDGNHLPAQHRILELQPVRAFFFVTAFGPVCRRWRWTLDAVINNRRHLKNTLSA